MPENVKWVDPWEEHPDIWKSKSAFFTWLRSGLRKAVWQFYPPKLKYKNAMCKKPPLDYKGKAKSGAYCALSGEWTGKSVLECDHQVGHVSLRDWEDVLPFIQHLCCPTSNMQLVSKEAHKIKSYAERMGITYEEAISEKSVVAFAKQTAEKQREELTRLGIICNMRSASDRKEAYRKFIKTGSKI